MESETARQREHRVRTYVIVDLVPRVALRVKQLLQRLYELVHRFICEGVVFLHRQVAVCVCAEKEAAVSEMPGMGGRGRTSRSLAAAAWRTSADAHYYVM